MIKAIETVYRGYRFRSRLEARWAVFFDALGVKWEYEPQGFELLSGRYLPDFCVTYPGRCEEEQDSVWFEVKPSLRSISASEWKKLDEFQEEYGLIILDGPPSERVYITPFDLTRPMEKVSNPKTGFPDYEQGRFRIPSVAAIAKEESNSRFGAALWCPKRRIWWDYGPDFFDDRDPLFPDDRLLISAIFAARQARFEHGQVGAPHEWQR